MNTYARWCKLHRQPAQWCVCVCVCVEEVYYRSFWETNQWCVESSENRVSSLSLSLSALFFSVSATGCSPAAHRPITCFSGSCSINGTVPAGTGGCLLSLSPSFNSLHKQLHFSHFFSTSDFSTGQSPGALLDLQAAAACLHGRKHLSCESHSR